LRVYVINLDRSQDRLAEFAAVNSHLTELERFPAIDGRSLDLAALVHQGLVTPDVLSSFSMGALGNALSHASLWQAAAVRNQPLTVAEDDVIFHAQFEALAAQVINELPPDWDFISWGWNFDVMMIFDMLPGVSPCIAQFDQHKMRLHTREFQQLSLSPRAHRLLWSFGMTSYTVSAKGAQILRSKCFPLRPMIIPWPQGVPQLPGSPSFHNLAIDTTLNGLYQHLNAYVCIPPLALTKNEHAKSTVQRAGSGTLAASPPPAAEPAQIAALNSRGMELQNAGRSDEALAQFDKVLSLKPDEVTALTRRGDILMDLGRFEPALADYDKLLSLRPNDAHALNMRGLALEHLKRPAEALASYDRAIAAAITSAEAYYNRGNILADLGRCEEALASYDKALAIKPDAALVLNNRGLALEELKRFDEAIASYEKALKVKPDYVAAENNRKLLLEELSRAGATIRQ